VSGPARALAALLAAGTLAGCYAGKPTDFGQTGDGVPFGVVVTNQEEARRAGLYVTSPDDDANCCWLAREAAFRTTLEPGTRRVRVTVELPAAGPYDQRPLDETVVVDGRARKTFRALRSGVWALDVAVPPPGRERPAEVRMSASYSWTAASLHLNGDTRPLSLQLRSVRAE
jgi:hypothetical protein